MPYVAILDMFKEFVLSQTCHILQESPVADDVIWKVVIVWVSLDGFTAMLLDQRATRCSSGEFPVSTIDDVEEDRD